jgi:hypothetical protein
MAPPANTIGAPTHNAAAGRPKSRIAANGYASRAHNLGWPKGAEARLW